MPGEDGGWPVVRLNALPVLAYPSICRRIVCEIGGMKEVRAVVDKSQGEIMAVRRKVGVLAFGGFTAVRTAFSKHNISEWDLHAIDVERLAFDSMELSLLVRRDCSCTVPGASPHWASAPQREHSID